MLKNENIALSGNRSAVKLDTRLKLLHILVAGVIFFTDQSWQSMYIYIICIALIMLTQKLYALAMKYFAFSTIIFAAFVLITANINSKIIGLAITIMFFIMRFLPFLMLGTLLTKTVEVTELIASLRFFKIPDKIVLPFSVTIRFIPTILDEVRIIKHSMAIRNIPLNFGSFLKRPLYTTELLLVPLMFRSSKIAEELAASAMTRAIDYPCEKTTLVELRFSRYDILYLLFIIGTTAGGGVMEVKNTCKN